MPPNSPLARLVAINGGSEIRVGDIPLIIGRHPSCDILLNSDHVSRFHCCLTGYHGDVVVRDLRSRNGTWLNGRRVEMARLRPGDELTVAHFRFRRNV